MVDIKFCDVCGGILNFLDIIEWQKPNPLDVNIRYQGYKDIDCISCRTKNCDNKVYVIKLEFKNYKFRKLIRIWKKKINENYINYYIITKKELMDEGYFFRIKDKSLMRYLLSLEKNKDFFYFKVYGFFDGKIYFKQVFSLSDYLGSLKELEEKENKEKELEEKKNKEKELEEKKNIYDKIKIDDEFDDRF